MTVEPARHTIKISHKARQRTLNSMRLKDRYFFIFFFLLGCQNVKGASSSSKELPDLSKVRQTNNAESDVDLSLSIGGSHHSTNIRQHTLVGKKEREQIANVYDTRTLKFKELQRLNPQLDLRTKKQKTKQITQKRYRENLISTLSKEQLEALKVRETQRKRISLKRRIEKIGYGYGKVGQLQMLKKKLKEQGQLSKEEDEKLKKLSSTLWEKPINKNKTAT